MYKLVTWDDTIDTVESEFTKTISGKDFSNFLELCFHHATSFSLNQATWANSTLKDLQTELEPFLIKEIFTSKWFGYDYTMAPPEDQRQMKVYLYKAETTAKNIILKYFYDIFFQPSQRGASSESSQDLEDLCFFSKEHLFVGTVSHAHVLMVFPPNEEFETFIKKLGDWNYLELIPMQLQQDSL